MKKSLMGCEKNNLRGYFVLPIIAVLGLGMALFDAVSSGAH
jgi:hypothetical protein